ncbi:MAG TPA: outer membrane protein [Pseudolabrys sp.]|nr:outer membrane protein [Pseudolabrys sp.]
MGWLKTAAVAGAALAMSGAVARAADMPGYPRSTMPEPGYKAPLVDLNSGWYLRGDLGAYWGLIDRADSASGFPNPTDNSLGKGTTAGLGVGIKTGWFRTDVTIDYATPMKYQGTITTPGDTTAKIQPTTGLVNGYLDLGTWYHMSPYIGAGAGVSYTRVTDYSSTGAPPFTGDTGKNQWKFSWAGMAGIAFAISHNLMADVGYRYLNIGDVATGSDALGAMTFKNVAAHEVRVGLRWSFDDLHDPH